MRFGTPIVPGDTITVWLSALTSTALNFTVALLSSSNTLFNVSTNSVAVTSGTTTAPYVSVTVVVPAGATGLYNEVWIWGNSGSFYLDAVKVSNSICASCPAGGVAPNLSSYTICPPATSLDISAITASNLPAGCTLSWHTAVPTTDANMITAPGSVTSGVYYASFRYSSSCYSGYNGDGTAATRIIVGTDGNCDGTPDFLDMDDDNDGIPDVIENNCTSPTSAPIVSGTGSGTSSGYQGSGNPIEDVTSYYPFNLPGAVFNTTGGTDASGITYTYNFPSPKTNIYFGFRNVDYYRRVFTDQDGNPIPLVLIGASSSQTQVDGNVLFDSNDCTVNSGTSADGVVMLLGTYTQVRMQLVLNTIGLSASCTSTDGWSGYFLELGCNASLDTDGDGIANSSDLDSDGDGCPDAVEAKVALQGGTVSSGVVAGPYNSLGYATSLESSYEDDNTVFTSEYKLFALSASLNLCTDTDSDGIVNVYDLDDDNDGILDAIESPSCFMTAAEQPMTGDRTLVPGVIATSDMDMTAGFPIEYAINGTNTDALNAKPTSYGPEEGSPITIEYPYPVNLSSMTVNWGTAATAGFRSNSGNFILQASNDGETWTTVGPTAGTNIVFNTPSPITFNVTQNAGLYKFYRIYHPTYLQSWTGTFEVTTALNTTGYNASMYPKGTTCTNGTDSDNIPNHLDTDSDGDGCPDAVEGGGSFTDGDLTNADNLCNTTSCVDINGIPTVATSSGQTIGDSQNASVQSADCVDNTDTDGDGTPDTTDSAPNDPCVDYTIGSEVITGSLWASADCDGDGVTNGAESTATVGPTTNPYNPCEFNVTEVSLVSTSTGDCDGDGVTNADEINGTDGNPLTTTDNTDANDPCDYNAVDQGTPSATWLAADCDGDGNPNGTDNNPLSPTALNDSGTAPFGTTTSINILNNDDFLANDGNTITNVGTGTAGGTIVFDPITGELDYTPLATEVGTTVTVVYEVCQGTVCDQATVTITIPASGDSDGDGVTDAQESIDGTDPNNPCSLVLTSVSQIATSTGDCDGDGVTNAAEINGPDGAVGGGDGTNPTNPCSLNVSQVTLTATSTGDCDGDGVTNADEINGTDGNPLTTTDNTDANDPCDYNAVDQGTPSATWLAADCDGDGNPNGTDNNPLTPSALNDSGTAPFGTTTSINILNNDDFLANDGNTITRTGGTAGGTVTFNPITGTMDYTPLASEVGTSVTVIYTVCNPVPNPDVCATATVTINVISSCVTPILKVLLEGPIVDNGSTGTMTTKLFNLGYLPGQQPSTFLGIATPAGQPYDTAPWFYAGSEGDAYTTALGPKAGYPTNTTDWVLVSLRTSTSVSSTVCTKAALLLNDGTVQMVSGFDCCDIDLNQTYFIVVEHRNHLITMSHVKVAITNNTISYDFTAQNSYRSLLGYGQKLINGKYVMYAGNGQQVISSSADTDINSNDSDLWRTQNGSNSSYYLNDFELNGDANVQDKNLWLLNNGVFSDVPR